MLMVQQYHSIHEIDQEFIPSIEILLEEEIPNFNILIKKHDTAPEKEMFTYYLFFGPAHNMPVGFAHLGLKFLENDFRTTSQKMKFWNKDHKHWKQLDWKLHGTSLGMTIFGQRAGVTNQDKAIEILNQYTHRDDIVSFNVFNQKSSTDISKFLPGINHQQFDHYFLSPLTRSVATYQDYLQSLEAESQNEIKKNWKELYKLHQIELGEYSHIDDVPTNLPFSSEKMQEWREMGAQVLTFTKNSSPLGCILMIEGKNGNFFFEPFPFETSSTPLVSDILYIQYAILKFFEFSHSRKCHILKDLNKLSFADKEDLAFFADQGFSFKHLVQSFSSRIESLSRPQ